MTASVLRSILSSAPKESSRTISPSSTATAPIVMMRSVAGFSPVVSESSTTKRTRSIGVSSVHVSLEASPIALEEWRLGHSVPSHARSRRELEQPKDRTEPALEHLPVVAAEQRRRELGAGRALADPDAPLLPQHDAEGIRRFAKNLLVLRQQRARRGKPLERRAAQHLARRHPKTRPTSTSGRSALCSSRNVDTCSPSLSTTAS